MGIALAAGALIGVRAATGSIGFWLLIAFATALSIPLATRGMSRWVLVCFAAGGLIGFGCGLLRAEPSESPLPSELPSPILGVITDDPVVTPRGSFATVRWTGADSRERSTRMFLPAAPRASNGDEVSLVPARTAGPPTEPIGVDSLVVVERAHGLDGFRNHTRELIERRLNARVSGAPGALALGLLVGDDSGLSGVRRDALRASGLAHLTAVSGWNVTVVVAAIGAAFAWRGWHGPFWTGLQIIGLAGFVWLVGAEPPVVRAALMCLAVFAARALGRPAHSITILALVAAAMVCLTPELLGSVSFQLTIAATAGLIVAGSLTRSITGWPSVVLLPTITAVVAGLATAPILAASYGTFTLATVPANLAAGPLVPPATFLALASVLLAPVPYLGTLSASATYLACRLILGIASTFAGIPRIHWTFAPLATPTLALITTLLLMAGALLAPEGRLLRRAAATWMETSPGMFAAAATGWAIAIVSGMVFL